MSANVGTSTKPSKPSYHETQSSWTEVAKAAREGVEQLFELEELIYPVAKDFLSGTGTAKKKLYIAVTKQAVYLIKMAGKDEAARISKIADLDHHPDEAWRQQQERAAKQSDAGWNAFGDCAIFGLSLVLGVYSGGTLLVIGGFAAGAKCAKSAFKYGEFVGGRQESFFDSGVGQSIDIGIDVVDLGLSVGKTYKVAAKGYMSWSKAWVVMSRAVGKWHGRNAVIQLAKLVTVQLPGLVLKGNDIRQKYLGIALTLPDVPRVLSGFGAAPSCGRPYEPIFRSPADWLRDTVCQGLIVTPWTREFQP